MAAKKTSKPSSVKSVSHKADTPISTVALSASIRFKGKFKQDETGPCGELAKSLGLAGDRPILSKTFYIVPNPYVIAGAAGDRMYQLVNGTFTILTDGTRTIYNLAWVAQSLGWSTVHNDNQAPDIVMLVTNAQGGVVDTWDVGRHHFTCAGGSTVFTNPNAQNIYTVATGGYFDLKAAFYYKNC